MREQRGETSPITILLLLAAVVALYGIWVYAPVFIDNLEVGKKCREAINSTWKYKDTDQTRQEFLNLIHGMGKIEVDVGGVMEKRPRIDPLPEDLQVELDHSYDPPILSIDVAYPREVELPLLGRTHVFWFEERCEIETSPVSY